VDSLPCLHRLVLLGIDVVLRIVWLHQCSECCLLCLESKTEVSLVGASEEGLIIEVFIPIVKNMRLNARDGVSLYRRGIIWISESDPDPSDFTNPDSGVLAIHVNLGFPSR
jgi:hypothetical protein